MKTRNIVVTILFLGTFLISAPAISAEENVLKFNKADTLQQTLSRHVGNRVELVLKSGQTLSGIVKELGPSILHLSELSGKEYFDALVRVDHVSAVIIRVKKS